MCVLFFASSLHHTVKRPASVEVFMHACSCMSNVPVMVPVHEWVCACLCVLVASERARMHKLCVRIFRDVNARA